MKRAVFAAMSLMMLSVTTATAEPINFDFDGGGDGVAATTVTTFDWAPGNSVLISNTVPGSFTILFQANLGFVDVVGSGQNLTQGTAGSYLTAVAGFGVLLDAVNSTASYTAFLFDAASGTNFFNVYADSVDNGSDVAGTGFTDGTRILSAHALTGDFSSSFTVTDDADANNNGSLDRDLDRYDDGLGGATNDYPGVYTFLGSGATQLQLSVDSFNPLYFLNLVAGSTLAFTNTSQVVPYNQVNPSAAFSSDGVANGDTCGVPCVGTINGAFIDADRAVAQSDANSSFEIAAQVPEPASVMLLGIGLLGIGAVVRRRKVS